MSGQHFWYYLRSLIDGTGRTLFDQLNFMVRYFTYAGGEPGAKIQVAMKCYAFGHDDLQSRVRTMVVPFQWL